MSCMAVAVLGEQRDRYKGKLEACCCSTSNGTHRGSMGNSGSGVKYGAMASSDKDTLCPNSRGAILPFGGTTANVINGYSLTLGAMVSSHIVGMLNAVHPSNCKKPVFTSNATCQWRSTAALSAAAINVFAHNFCTPQFAAINLNSDCFAFNKRVCSTSKLSSPVDAADDVLDIVVL